MKRHVCIETTRVMDEAQFKKWTEVVTSMMLLSPDQMTELLRTGRLLFADDSGSTTYKIEGVN